MGGSQEASQAIASGGYNFQIILPDWKPSQEAKDAKQQEADKIAKQKKNQNMIAFGVLAAIVIAIVFFTKSNKKA